MALSIPMVRAESTYTFGSLVRASSYMATWPRMNDIFRIADQLYMIHGSLLNQYSILFDADPQILLDRIVRTINGTAERGVEIHENMVPSPNPYVTANLDGTNEWQFWLTARAYGPVTYANVVETGPDWQPVVPYTGDRGMSDEDFVRLGSHNYRFVDALPGAQADRILLELGYPSIEENISVMRDRLLATINADPAGAGVFYGVNTVKNKMIVAYPGNGHDEIRLVCSMPGAIGNEIQLKDSGDGAFSGGDQMAGGSGDMQEWLDTFIKFNQLSSETIAELRTSFDVYFARP